MNNVTSLSQNASDRNDKWEKVLTVRKETAVVKGSRGEAREEKDVTTAVRSRTWGIRVSRQRIVDRIWSRSTLSLLLLFWPYNTNNGRRGTMAG